MSESKRRIWILADAHIGHTVDGVDGADWLRMAVEDMRENVEPVDYAINLGDMSRDSKDEQLAAYAEIRDGSHIDTWYELVGNHDFKSVASGLFEKHIRCPRYWSLIDGNVAFFSLPHERGNAAGLFLPEVEGWLRQAIPSHAGKNIIMAAHSFPYDTVEFSTRMARCMHPRTAVETFLESIRIDVWLGGHIHFRPRSTACTARRGPTTFINAANVSHVYGTEASLSFVLEFTIGSRFLRAQCRHHDRRCFIDEQEVNIELPEGFAKNGEPVFEAVPLEIPERYGRIPEEVADAFPTQ